GDVEQLIKRIWIAAVQFGKLLFNEPVVIVFDRNVPVKLAFVARIENAVIEPMFQFVLFASVDKLSHNIGFVPTGGNVVVVILGVPQAKSRHVFRGQHGVTSTEVMRDADPLADVKIGRIVSACRHATSLVVVSGKGVHTEVK